MPLQDNRIRAVLRGPDEVVLGIGTRAPQIVGGLTRREARALAAAGPLTALEWSRLWSSKPPSDRWRSVVSFVSGIVGTINPPAALAGTLAVVGDPCTAGVIASALAPLVGGVLHDQVQVDYLETALLLADSAASATAGAGRAAPDLVVLVAHEVLPASDARGWQRLGVAHLPVVFSGDGCAIGPLVRGPDDVCALCLELHRTDHDPQWPVIAAQFDGAGARLPCAAADLAALAAGLTGSVVRGLAGGTALAPGVVVTARLGDPITGCRQWPRHPRCPRHPPP